ncbi:MAG: hypothetical protein WCJ64_09260 [Rhodospirillaceae bacterium]
MTINLDAIKLGARYRHPVGASLVYRVVRLVELDQHSPHAVLMADAVNRRLITVGIGVLQDITRWVRVK